MRPGRIVLFTIGWILVGLAVLGIFLPVLPTTPLLILATACFVRSSDKAYHWILSNKTFGPLIKNYLEHRVVPLRAKITAICTLWLLMGVTLIATSLWLGLKVVIALVGAGVSLYLLSLKPK